MHHCLWHISIQTNLNIHDIIYIIWYSIKKWLWFWQTGWQRAEHVVQWSSREQKLRFSLHEACFILWMNNLNNGKWIWFKYYKFQWIVLAQQQCVNADKILSNLPNPFILSSSHIGNILIRISVFCAAASAFCNTDKFYQETSRSMSSVCMEPQPERPQIKIVKSKRTKSI